MIMEDSSGTWNTLLLHFHLGFGLWKCGDGDNGDNDCYEDDDDVDLGGGEPDGLIVPL